MERSEACTAVLPELLFWTETRAAIVAALTVAALFP
jgi:hypothetical protein